MPLLAVALLYMVSIVSGCQYAKRSRQLTADERNQSWHAHYHDGWMAIRVGDHAQAQQHLTEALRHATHFDSADRRLPETLDDLGLVYFQLGKDFEAEQMQGQAVTELLLAKGARDPDLPIFIARLGYIYQRQGRPSEISPIQEQPYMIFEKGYAIHNLRLAERLDALSYEYERDGNTEAVKYLSALARSIRKTNAATHEPFR